MKLKLFILILIIGAVGSFLDPTEEDKQGIDTENKINLVCVDIKESFNNIVNKGNDLVRYDKALDNYARTGLYQDTGFNTDAPSDYYNAYQWSAMQLTEIKANLEGPTLILASVLRDFIKIAQNPEATVSPLGEIYTAKWNARSGRIKKLSAYVDALCQPDETIRTNVTYSVSSTCGLKCHFSQKSKIVNVLVPDDTKVKKFTYGSWDYQTKIGSVSEISKFYLSTLSSKGWRLLPGDSLLDPTMDSEGGFSVAQVWCRTSPTFLNMVLSVSDTAELPGVTSIVLMTDKDKSYGCE